jgi:uroporphyrinogen decarboxylase
MMEGGSADAFTHAKALFYSDPKLFSALMEKLTAAVTELLRMQIEAGVDAVQVFDSLGDVLAPEAYAAASARWMKQIVSSLRFPSKSPDDSHAVAQTSKSAVSQVSKPAGCAKPLADLEVGDTAGLETCATKPRVPVIVFGRGAHASWDALTGTGAQVLGVDWQVRLEDVAKQLPGNIAVQGNLDPFLLTTTPGIVAAETRRILSKMKDRAGHIFNLGHGVPPAAKLDCIQALVDTIRAN